MGCRTPTRKSAKLWALARRQHWVVTRPQLLELGYGREAINHRIRAGRLHPIHRGVYAVARPDLTQYGRWMAAALACGPDTAVSHFDAAGLWQLLLVREGAVHVSVPRGTTLRRPGLEVHHRAAFERTVHRDIPVTICPRPSWPGIS